MIEGFTVTNYFFKPPSCSVRTILIYWVTATAVTALLLFGFIGIRFEPEREEYCKMVRIHQDTNGRHGWPDYQGAYESQCAVDTEAE